MSALLQFLSFLRKLSMNQSQTADGQWSIDHVILDIFKVIFSFQRMKWNPFDSLSHDIFTSLLLENRNLAEHSTMG